MKIVAVEPIGMNSSQMSYYEKIFSRMGHQFICFPDKKEDPETLKQRMRHADVAILSNVRLTNDVLSYCSRLKVLSVAFTGTEHIDMGYCQDQGIKVFNASGYATVAVAELTIGLIIDLYRHITLLDAETRKGGTRRHLLGQQLNGKVVGVIGTGAIGRQTAFYLQALGCNIIAWDRAENEKIVNAGIPYVTLDDLLSTSDIVTLHVPLTAETENLISFHELDLCKPSAIIINTARGKLINMTALSEALRNKKIAGAAVDVFETEPPLPGNHPLLNAPNCILAPHIGYATREAFDTRIGIAMNNVVNWLKDNSSLEA